MVRYILKKSHIRAHITTSPKGKKFPVREHETRVRKRAELKPGLITRQRIDIYKDKLHRRAIRIGKNPPGALLWLDDNYTGNSKKAMRHQVDCFPFETTAEMELREFYRTAITSQQRESLQKAHVRSHTRHEASGKMALVREHERKGQAHADDKGFHFSHGDKEYHLPYEQTADVPVEKLERNEEQPRTSFDPEKLKELATSIKEIGLQQPILARPHPNPEKRAQGMMQIVAGERRWRAHKQGGMSHAKVILKKLTDKETAEIALMENITRQDLDPIEEAWGYRKLQDKGYSLEDLAKKTGEQPDTVKKKIGLTKLVGDLQMLIKKGQLGKNHGFVIGSFNLDEGRQRKVLEQLVQRKMSPNELRGLCQSERVMQDQGGLFGDKFELTAKGGGKKSLIEMVGINKRRTLSQQYQRLQDQVAGLLTKLMEKENYKLLPALLSAEELPRNAQELRLVAKQFERIANEIERASEFVKRGQGVDAYLWANTSLGKQAEKSLGRGGTELMKSIFERTDEWGRIDMINDLRTFGKLTKYVVKLHKSHIKQYTRKTGGGKLVVVRQHETKKKTKITDLPTLVGSPGHVKWANQIRSYFLKRLQQKLDEITTKNFKTPGMLSVCSDISKVKIGVGIRSYVVDIEEARKLYNDAVEAIYATKKANTFINMRDKDENQIAWQIKTRKESAKNLTKSHVRSHTRKTGVKLVYVREHETKTHKKLKTPEPQAQKIKKPDWSVLEILRQKHHEFEHSLGNCDNCGTTLYAKLYIIKNNKTDRKLNLGSECVKKFTGKSAAQIRAEEAEYAGAMADAEEERERILTIKKFYEANREVIEHLEMRAAREEKTNNRLIAEYFKKEDELKKRGEEMALFSFPQTTTFWQDLAGGLEKYGTLTENQMEVVKRDMKLDLDKELPVIGSEVEVKGKVLKAVAKQNQFKGGYSDTVFDAQLLIDRGNGQNVLLRISPGTKLWDELKININKDRYGNPTSVEHPPEVHLKGTVKWQDPAGGRFSIKRAKVASDLHIKTARKVEREQEKVDKRWREYEKRNSELIQRDKAARDKLQKKEIDFAEFRKELDQVEAAEKKVKEEFKDIFHD